MRFAGSKAGLPMRLGILLLLLCAQSFTLTHELGHDLADETSLCAICSIGHGLHAGVSVSHAPPACEPSAQMPLFESPVHQPQITTVAFSARAPPTFL
ncbi:MAG: hypothetical protein RQ826_08145 [Xanthomonadales bacterium]|nr:hypothetical protein [Xanthomonadales bacterium]